MPFQGDLQMNAFRVWMRALGNSSQLLVEGEGNARRLLDRLQDSFVFKSSEPFRFDAPSGTSTFDVPYGGQVTRLTLERLLARIPEAILTVDPVPVVALVK
jgi:hypothetical protein